MPENIRTRCLYQVLDNGIHEFVMTETSRAAVDEFIDCMREMIESVENNQATPTLFDTQVGVQPINYIFTSVRKLTQEYPNSSSQERGKMAMIMKPNALMTAVQGLMSVFPKLKVRFFPPEERDAAIAWLLTD